MSWALDKPLRRTGVDKWQAFSPDISSNLLFLPLGLRLMNFESGDGVLVTNEVFGGESLKVSLFLGLVLVGKSSLAIPVLGLVASLDMHRLALANPLGGVA